MTDLQDLLSCADICTLGAPSCAEILERLGVDYSRCAPVSELRAQVELAAELGDF